MSKCDDFNYEIGRINFPSYSSGVHSGGGIDMYEQRLRDSFAIAALSTMTFITKPYDTTESVADSCYRMADAMLARRKK
jgi:hypothetical protein